MARGGGHVPPGNASISDLLRSLLVPFWVKQQEFRPGVGPAYQYLYPSAYVVWGHAPLPGKFFEFNAVRWLLRLFWGPKHHYYLLLLCWHGNKILIHFTFACMEVSIHRRFQSPGEPCEEATHPSRSELFSVTVDFTSLRMSVSVWSVIAQRTSTKYTPALVQTYAR